MARRLMTAAAAMCLLLVAACSDDSTTPSVEDAPPEIGLSFTQWGPMVGTDRALLRVENRGDEALVVTGVGLDWPGFGGEFEQPKGVTVAPGQLLDLTIDLPALECAATQESVVAFVESGADRVRGELDPSGQRFVRDLWADRCAQQLLEERLAIGYTDRWESVGTGIDEAVVGRLRLTRRSGDDPVRLLAAQGSVLYDVALAGASTLPAGRRTVLVPIEFRTGNRCDEHAVGQATRPFDFLLDLRIGDLEPMTVSITPPVAGQAAVTSLLERVCRARSE